MTWRGWNLMAVAAMLFVIMGLAVGGWGVAVGRWELMALAGLLVGAAVPVSILAVLESVI